MGGRIAGRLGDCRDSVDLVEHDARRHGDCVEPTLGAAESDSRAAEGPGGANCCPTRPGFLKGTHAEAAALLSEEGSVSEESLNSMAKSNPCNCISSSV